jgi:hypothetical protein
LKINGGTFYSRNITSVNYSSLKIIHVGTVLRMGETAIPLCNGYSFFRLQEAV